MAFGGMCRKAGLSEATFYNWRKRYAGQMPSEVKRLRQLEDENAKLKWIAADLSLDKAMLQDVMSKSSFACQPPTDGGLPCALAAVASLSIRWVVC